MARITEDYVSFKTAKLLKEKEFDIPCWNYYDTVGNFTNDYLSNHNFQTSDTSAPTLQMAMKWLREVHNISIEPLVDFGSGEEYWWTADIGYIKKDGLVTELCGYDSYEDAVEAAIKYCLEHLI